MTSLAPRLDGLQRDRPWLSLPIGVVKRFGEHQGGRMSAAITHFAFFSLFPLLLVFVSVLDLVLESRPEVRADLVDSVLGRLPLVGSRIDAPEAADGRLTTVFVGLGLSLWAGLGAMAALAGAFATVWDVRPGRRPNFLVARLTGLAALIGVGLLVALSTVVGNAPALLGGGVAIAVLGLVTNLAANVVGLLLVFVFMTPTADSWRRHVPGAIVGGIAVFALQQAGGSIARRYVESSSDTYGTLAVVIGLLAWLHLVSQVVVLSAQLNAVLARELFPRSLDDTVVSEADRRAMLLNTERVLHDRQLSPVVSVPDRARTDW